MKHLLLIALLSPLAAYATDEIHTLVIKDHRFQPAEIIIPSGLKVKLLIQNQDATPEEFESKKLDREKIIAGKGSATISIGPLAPGRYPFFGEFNEATAQGIIIVK